MYRSIRARWCGRPAFYAGETPARLAVSSRTARLLSDPIISFYKIQKVNSLLGHTSYGRIHNVQPAQECRPSEREQQQPSLLGIGLHSCARQNGNAHAQCDAPLERCRVIHDGNDSVHQATDRDSGGNTVFPAWCPSCPRAGCPPDAASRGAWKLKFTRSIRRLSWTAGLRSSRARRWCFR